MTAPPLAIHSVAWYENSSSFIAPSHCCAAAVTSRVSTNHLLVLVGGDRYTNYILIVIKAKTPSARFAQAYFFHFHLIRLITDIFVFLHHDLDHARHLELLVHPP